MKRCQAALITNNPAQSQIPYVYSEKQIQEIASVTNLHPGIAGPDDIASGALREVEVLFSTWGMPVLSDAQLDLMPSLKAVFYSAGATDSFARPLFARGIRLFSAWRANAIPVAEFCLGQILLGLKGYFRASRMLKSPEYFNIKLCGPGAYGETVALIGAGAISNHIRDFLKNFQVNVITVPSRKEKRTVSLEEAFSRAMVVSNHLPNRDDNVGVLNGDLFRSMREGAVFINTGRGRQVNEAELIEVLESRPDLTALLDVTWPEPPEAGSRLYTLPNVVLSPHIAGSINDEVHRMSDYMIAEYKRFASDEPCLHEVCESMLLTSQS